MQYTVTVATMVPLFKEIEVEATSEQEARIIVQKRLDFTDNGRGTAQQMADPRVKELTHQVIEEAIADIRHENVCKSGSGWNVGFPDDLGTAEIVYVSVNRKAEAA